MARTFSLPLLPLPAPAHCDTLELLDVLLDVAPITLAQNLRDIRRINRYFGGTSVVLAQLSALLHEYPRGSTVSVLDVATGSGDIPLALVHWGDRHGYDVRVVATDFADDVLIVARHETANEARIVVEACDARALPYHNGAFDIVTCSLALHHFARADAVQALAEMRRVARRGVIVNDLARSWSGYVGAWLLGTLITRNRLTRHDAPLSVLRAWTPEELRIMAVDAGMTGVTVSSHPFCRQALVSDASA